MKLSAMASTCLPVAGPEHTPDKRLINTCTTARCLIRQAMDKASWIRRAIGEQKIEKKRDGEGGLEEIFEQRLEAK